jgi:hypothetical protein
MKTLAISFLASRPSKDLLISSPRIISSRSRRRCIGRMGGGGDGGGGGIAQIDEGVVLAGCHCRGFTGFYVKRRL